MISEIQLIQQVSFIGIKANSSFLRNDGMIDSTLMERLNEKEKHFLKQRRPGTIVTLRVRFDDDVKQVVVASRCCDM